MKNGNTSAPLVSILIPAFNAEEWIAETVCSALAQTWSHKEVIVVDDGSTDNTFSVLQRFNPDRVRVVKQQNKGAAAARNTAFSLSRGQYIQWLDADDLLAPDKIALQLQVLERCGSSRTLVSSAWAQFSYRWYRAKFRPTALWCDLSPLQWLSTKMGMNLYMPNHSWLVSRELTECAGLWDATLSVDDDGEYFCRVLLQADDVRFVPASRVYYRVSGSGSVSNIGVSDQKLIDQWRSMQLHIRYLRSLDDTQATREACLAFLRTWFGYFYPQRPDIVTQVQKLAAELGGQMQIPRLGWKYAWIATIFGRNLARRAEVLLPRLKWWFLRRLERTIFRIERRKSAGSFELNAQN